MMHKFSIRSSLTLWYSAILLLGMAIFGGAMWFALAHRLMTGVESRLRERVEGLRTVLVLESHLKDWKLLQLELSEFAREVPDGMLMQMRDAGGRILLPAAAEPLFSIGSTADSPAYSTVVRERKAYRTLTTRIRVGTESYDVLVAGSLDETTAVLRDFRHLLLLMIPGLVMVACLGGYWISRRALSPVDEITRVARSISVQNLSRRLTVPQTGDELQRMSETWNQVLERLDGAVHRIRQFTADASHELRTPVALILATADLALRRERTVSEYQKSLSDIRAEAERMTNLTESLLTLARSDADGIRLPLASVDLNEVVREVVVGIQPMAEMKSIALYTETMNSPALISANALAIQRLLRALIDNAMKYTARGGAIIVSTAAANGGILLSVKDTGEGIQPEALPHIFERFFRADPARSTGSGAGLGLSIAKAIAEAHGSDIVVESTPGVGSRFELLLRIQPLLEANTPAAGSRQ
jgi:two-component system heavy metal sensor histidine kinase CusS